MQENTKKRNTKSKLAFCVLNCSVQIGKVIVTRAGFTNKLGRLKPRASEKIRGLITNSEDLLFLEILEKRHAIYELAYIFNI